MSRLVALLHLLILCFSLCESQQKSPTIFNGKNANFGQFPWMVFVKSQMNMNTSYPEICSGTILNTNTILTAAHCVCHFEEKYISIAVGKLNLTANENSLKAIVEEVILHPTMSRTLGSQNCTKKTGPADFAILRLKEELKFNKTVNKIPLDCKDTSEGQNLTIMGYGMLQLNKTKTATILRYDTVKITKCLVETDTDEGYICAKGSNVTGVLGGDSGGPLVTSDKKSNYKVVGVIGGRDSDTGENFFANIPKYCDWIKNPKSKGTPSDGTTTSAPEGTTTSAPEGTTKSASEKMTMKRMMFFIILSCDFVLHAMMD